MRRILSYLVLLMLFATSGYASIPLTPSMWQGGGTPQHVLFRSTDTAFGLQTPNATQYADLSGYSKLVVTVSEGSPRAFFNATGTQESQRLTNPHMTKNGNTFTYDLEAIVAENDFAHLNSIKAAASWVELTVTSIQLVEKSENTRSWDFTTSSSTDGLTVNYDTSYPQEWVYISGIGYTVQRGVDVVITIPNVTGGNIINFDLISQGGHNRDKAWSIKCNGQELIQGGNGANVGSKSATVPNTVTTPTTAIITLKGYSTSDYLGISKLEVKAPSIYFTDLKIDGENDEGANPYIDDFRNNVLSVPYSDIGKTTEFKFQLKDANGTVITNASPNDFTITSTDGNVINVNNVPITGPNSDGEYTISGIGLQQQGTAYIKITYGGITETHPINIKKKPVYIRAGGGAAFTKNLGDADWQILFHLCEEGSTTAIALDKTDYYSTSGFKNNTENDDNGVVQNTATNLYNNSLNKWFSAKHIGSDVLVIRFRNHPLYEDCDAEFAFTVLKQKQDISYPQEFQDWTITYNEAEGYNLRTEVNNLLNTDLSNPTTHTNITVNNGIWTYTPSGKQITFKSSDTNVLTVNANTGKIQWTGNAGTATITATVAGDDTWASAEASFTVTINGDNAGPRLIWLTGYNTTTANNNNYTRGARYGYNWFKTDNIETDEDGNEIIIQREQNNIIPYNDDAWFQAVALKPGTTNAQLLAAGLQYYPYKTEGGDDYFYWVETREDNPGGWRYDESPIAQFLYNNDYYESGKIVYTVDVETSLAGTFWKVKDLLDKDKNKLTAESPDKGISVYLQATGGQVGFGSRLHIGSTYGDSLTITATYPGIGRTNPGVVTTKTWVNSKSFGFSFQPEEGVVNKDRWIIPYVKFPDLQLVDFEKIWVTIDNEVAVSVEGADDMFSLSKVINPSTSQPYATMDAAIDAINACNSETDLKRMLGGYFDYFKLKHDETLGWMIEGIYPKIWGLTVGEEADVTIHIVGSTYNGTKKFTNAEATYHVTVVGENEDLFHWEMNNDVTGHDDKQIKTIYMIEGDYIYMPGIVGNPNGNDDYSKEGSYKYVYGIQEGDIIMNFKPYFWREGIANYFFTYNVESTSNGYSKYKPSSERLIPATHTSKNDAPEALIFWASGLGDYYRNDSLIIYANKKTDNPIYLWAEDPQTGNCCTPIKIQIFSRESLISERQESLKDMTYPFTWDFEHMNLCGLEEIKQDAHNGYYYTNDRGEAVYGNGGTYWRKRWDSSGGSTLRSPHGVDKKYYQYNGVFNADYDDKDNNYSQSGYDENGKIVSGSRQRWFKDLSANGTYLDMFKGLRLNIAGLDYWEQKYTRFNVATDPAGGIFFEGGVHYLSLPGFGVNGSAIITDATRERGSLPMPGSQVHFNTNDNNCTKDYFNRSYNGNADAGSYVHANILNTTTKRNNRVYFVIKAEGNSDKSVIYVGGRRMMMKTNSNTPNSQIGIGTGTQIGENGTLYSDGHDHDYTHKISLTTSKKVYIIPLDPWDDDYQEQIYLAMDKGVHIYWMGISTEPRDLRDDYETYAYSYPVDLDMEKTNEVMTTLTEQEYGTAITMKPYYGSGYNHYNKSLIVSEYPLDDDYKVAKNEGLQFYPSARLHDVSGLQDKLPSKTVKDKTVLKAVVDAEGKPVYNDNGTYRFEPVTYDYTYHYLPTYFIANAQNMDKTNYKNNVGGRGKATTLNEKNAPTNDNPAILSKEIKYEDGTTKTVPTYNKFNRLTDASYSVFVYKDYYSQDGTMPTENDNGIANKGESGYYHFIPLGIINEYIRRYLAFDEDNDYKVITQYLQGLSSGDSEAELKPGRDLENLPQNENGEFDDVITKQYYYDLIGPGVVRYYRANNNNYMKGRRSYLKLTWQEYQIDTYGKAIDGASTGNETTNSSGGSNEVDPNVGDPDFENKSREVQGVKIMFANSFTDNDDDVLVSEDGGFPDGIEEVKQDTDNGAFYNLNGTRVTTPRKGVYIHNGKKVIIK